MLLTGIKPDSIDHIKDIFNFFNKKGVNELIITLGSFGSYYVSKDVLEHHDICKTTVVDTTSAGDTFIGALSYKKSLGEDINKSMDFAAVCSSITVSRKGAGISIPTLDEVLNKINK